LAVLSIVFLFTAVMTAPLRSVGPSPNEEPTFAPKMLGTKKSFRAEMRQLFFGLLVDTFSYRNVFPNSRVCPRCGSASYSTVAAKMAIAFRGDRICRECQTTYTPPTPSWAAVLFCVIGVGVPIAISLAVILIAPADLKRIWPHGLIETIFLLVLSAAGSAACFSYGLWCLKGRFSTPEPEDPER
jgi:hypothetical protein